MSATSRRPTKAGATLWPKEHGAYAMLVFPLLSVLVFAPAAPSVLLTFGLVFAFLAHEPLLILLGRRGPRALRSLGPAARRRLVFMALGATALGAAGLWLAPVALRFIAWPLGLAVVVGVFMATGREKTVAGELLVSATFASACLPLGVAGGASPASMLWVTGVWFATFALEALAVKATLSRLKGKRPGLLFAAAALPTLALLLAIALASLGFPIAWALAPACVASFVLAWVHVHPRKLRVVGWALVGTDAAVLLSLLLLR
ncbi:MAG: YwiC-like family protein [Deltaproteobacteria bacterium]|nr:YwiC-like family protein [Deltaproteobacteria bacterium]